MAYNSYNGWTKMNRKMGQKRAILNREILPKKKMMKSQNYWLYERLSLGIESKFPLNFKDK